MESFAQMNDVLGIASIYIHGGLMCVHTAFTFCIRVYHHVQDVQIWQAELSRRYKGICALKFSMLAFKNIFETKFPYKLLIEISDVII